jgi:hypothetical protein
MSTEHQQYSTENQEDAIRQYAARRGIEIVRTYADEGKSGLRLDGRDALKQLLADVQKGNTEFSLILVYDVSRWGSRMPMKPRTMNSSAGVPGSMFSIAPSRSRTTEASALTSRKCSSARWPANTAASFRSRSLPGNVA